VPVYEKDIKDSDSSDVFRGSYKGIGIGKANSYWQYTFYLNKNFLLTITRNFNITPCRNSFTDKNQ